eukprot:m.547971 g.547971  ORF g.547971 m.547971 type:complete len:600 (+) comp57712_c0_seq1:159-1958(+)
MITARNVLQALTALSDGDATKTVGLHSLFAFVQQTNPDVNQTTLMIALRKAVKDGLVLQKANLFSIAPARTPPLLVAPSPLPVVIPRPVPTPRLEALASPATRSLPAGLNLFLYHRDLRLADNTAMLKAPRPLVPIFIFTPRQVDPRISKHYSSPKVQFICESLRELDADLKALGTRLHVFYGDTVEVLAALHRHVPIASISQNRDYTKFSIERDTAIAAWCASQSPPIEYIDEEDYDIVRAGELLQADGRPYTTLAAYYTLFLKEKLTRRPSFEQLDPEAFLSLPPSLPNAVSIDQSKSFYTENINLAQRGGRSNGLAGLATLHSMKAYDQTKSFPAARGNTMMSAHLRYGTISVREFYWSIVNVFGTHDNSLIRELVFRSFYIKICSARLELQDKEAFRSDIDCRIPWRKPDDKNYHKYWTAWVTGTTGYPLADAGMRQLHASGYMHGRVRMASATLLTRYMLIDWREGARYFAQHLFDSDPCSNNMGWQFSAALSENEKVIFQPPMNLFQESRTIDANADYIKRWLPELQDVTPSDIHSGTWPTSLYPRPILPLPECTAQAMQIWSQAAQEALATGDSLRIQLVKATATAADDACE